MIFCGTFFFFIWLHFYYPIFLLSRFPFSSSAVLPHFPPHTFYHLIKLGFFMNLMYFFNDESFHFLQYGIIFMNKMHQDQDLKTSFWDWWQSRSWICDSPNHWSSLMDEIKYKSWKFSQYMANCITTDSVYSFNFGLLF